MDFLFIMEKIPFINIVVYLSVDTNPSDSSILGFGTWEKIVEASVNGVFAYKRTG